jgi:predicted nucleotidyltransferase
MTSPVRFARPLDDVFRSRSYIQVLRALHGLPDGFRASSREIARRAGITHPTASSALFSLADQGLVILERAPRADLFRLNRGHALAHQLSSLFEWEQNALADLLSFLKESIERETDSIEAALLFGSAAKGTMTTTSDIDVAVVCPVDRVEEVEAVMERVGEAVRARFGNRLNIVLGNPPALGTQRAGGGKGSGAGWLRKAFRFWALSRMNHGMP